MGLGSSPHSCRTTKIQGFCPFSGAFLVPLMVFCGSVDLRGSARTPLSLTPSDYPSFPSIFSSNSQNPVVDWADDDFSITHPGGEKGNI